MGAGLDSEIGKTALAAAIAALAIANLDLSGDQLDKSLCKLVPIVLASIGAYWLLVIETGEQSQLLIDLETISKRDVLKGRGQIRFG